MGNVLDTLRCKQPVRTVTWTSWSCCSSTTWTWSRRFAVIRLPTSFTRHRYGSANVLTSAHCYSGQGRGSGRAPCRVRGWGLRHRGAAKGRSRLERQKQAEADAAAHSRQQGPLAGGQDSPWLWLPPQPAGILSFLDHGNLCLYKISSILKRYTKTVTHTHIISGFGRWYAPAWRH